MFFYCFSCCFCHLIFAAIWCSLNKTNAEYRGIHPVAETLPRKPKLDLPGRLACQPEPAERAKKPDLCGLLPVARNPPNAHHLWTITQRPKGLMVNELFS